jgi:hypothetical protein
MPLRLSAPMQGGQGSRGHSTSFVSGSLHYLSGHRAWWCVSFMRGHRLLKRPRRAAPPARRYQWRLSPLSYLMHNEFRGIAP